MEERDILDALNVAASQGSNPWYIISADDDGMVHMVTEMILKDFRFEDRPVKIINTYSAKETLEVLRNEPRVAVLLLDVVMESMSAGLDAIPAIRGDLKNHEVRIVLRTGQAGRATVSDVIRQYDINDFRDKTALDHNRLLEAITLALRNYRDIQLAKTASSAQ